MRRAILLLSLFLAAPALPAENASAPVASAQPSLLEYLNQAIAWYRGFAALAPLATEPAEVLVYNDARQTALEMLRLAFQFARADVALLHGAPAPAPEQQASSGRVDPQKMQKLLQQWGQLPPREQARALQELTRGMSPRHREAIENYFRNIAGAQR